MKSYKVTSRIDTGLGGKKLPTKKPKGKTIENSNLIEFIFSRILTKIT